MCASSSEAFCPSSPKTSNRSRPLHASAERPITSAAASLTLCSRKAPSVVQKNTGSSAVGSVVMCGTGRGTGWVMTGTWSVMPINSH